MQKRRTRLPLAQAQEVLEAIQRGSYQAGEGACTHHGGQALAPSSIPDGPSAAQLAAVTR